MLKPGSALSMPGVYHYENMSTTMNHFKNCSAHLLVWLSCFLFLNPGLLSAQSWQWGRRGGGMFDGGSPTPREAVVGMATDQAGNVYILAIAIHDGWPDIDGSPLATFGDRDIVIARLNCDGTYKWSKVIGGASMDYPGAIGTDTLGHVYVSGKTYDDLPPYNVHFDTDSVQQPGNEKSLFLVQYDTSGNFKWLRQPNPDTATHLNTYTCQSYDMKVMPDGDVYWLAKLHEGLVSGGKGWATTDRRPYILHYDLSGNMISHTDLEMETDVAAFYSMQLEKTRNGNFIIAGGQDYYPGVSKFTMGGNAVTHSLYVGMFNSAGKFLWKRENDSSLANSKFSCRPLSDDSGHIYLAGTLSNNDSFNTFKHTNTIRPAIPYSSDPFICKIDTSGNMIWIKAASGNAANYTASVQFKNDKELWLSGDYTSVHWDTAHYVQTVPNEGTHFYVSRFSTSGKVLGIDSLKGAFKSFNYFYCSAADNKGGLYIGGELYSTLDIAGRTLSSHGGMSDFLVAKWGYACNCTVPVAAFSASVAGNTVTLTYTGTALGIDSIVWDYGNGIIASRTGSTATAPFSYTYPSNGTYTLCATVYTDCGSDTYCSVVTVSGLGIDGVSVRSQITLSPNPARDYVRIEGAEDGANARLLNGAGQEMIPVFRLAGHNMISLKGFPAGLYLLVITNESGLQDRLRIVKQ